MDKDLIRIKLPIIKRIIPSIIAHDILSVQPMQSMLLERPSVVKLVYWEYHDGATRKGGTDKYPFIPQKGWSCWAYASHVKQTFEQWMKDNMQGEYECDFRFNSGDPMFTIRIVEDEDATMFKLRWDNAIE